MNYRDYKGFVNDFLQSDLLQEINCPDSSITHFKKSQIKHAPLKVHSKTVSDNRKPFKKDEKAFYFMLKALFIYILS